MIRIEAVWTVVGRVKRRSILLHESRLPVKSKPIHFQRSDWLRENCRIDTLAADPVIESEANALNIEVRIECLRSAREIHVARAKLRGEIFEPGGPVRT